MQTPRLAALFALALLLFAGCVQPGSTGSGAKSSSVLLKVNGRAVTAAEFVAAPPIRNAIKQYIMLDTMKAECAKRGIKVDEAEVDKRIADLKQNLTLSGESWEGYLKENAVTEEEYRDMLRGPMLFEALAKEMTAVTDEDVKKAWADPNEKERLVSVYAADNHLPESDKAKLSLEDEKFYAFAKDNIQGAKTMGQQGDIIQQFIDQITLDLSPTIADPARSRLYEDLIINNSKTKPEDKAAGEKEGVVLTPPEGEGAGAEAAPAPDSTTPPETEAGADGEEGESGH